MDNSKCPVCFKHLPNNEEIEVHVNKCLFLNSSEKSPPTLGKRKNFGIFMKSPKEVIKKPRSDHKQQLPAMESQIIIESDDENEKNLQKLGIKAASKEVATDQIPLSERMRPNTFESYFGQNHVMDKNAILRKALENNDIPSMIFWGPPGCGKVN